MPMGLKASHKKQPTRVTRLTRSVFPDFVRNTEVWIDPSSGALRRTLVTDGQATEVDEDGRTC